METASDRRRAIRDGHWPAVEAYLHAHGSATTTDIVRDALGIVRPRRARSSSAAPNASAASIVIDESLDVDSAAYDEDVRSAEAFLGSLARDGLLTYAVGAGGAATAADESDMELTKDDEDIDPEMEHVGRWSLAQ